MSGPVLPGPGQPQVVRLAHSLAPPCWQQPGGGAVGVSLGTAVGVAEDDGLAEAVAGGWLPADLTAGAGLEQAASSAPAPTMTASRTATAAGRTARRPDAIAMGPLAPAATRRGAAPRSSLRSREGTVTAGTVT